MWPTLVPRISSGFINTVNDAVDGDPTSIAYINASSNQGQIGKVFHFDDFTIASIYNSTVGTVYGGLFQYVKLAAAAGGIVPGQVLFWDIPADATAGVYQVTTNEVISGTDAACQIAGVCLNSTWTAGNYAFIQVAGRVNIKYRAVLTSAGAINGGVFTAATGGADTGFADVLAQALPTQFSDVSLMQRRFLGTQITAAANGALRQVFLGFTRVYF